MVDNPHKRLTERETMIRDWNNSFNQWVDHGNPRDSNDCPIPCKHPDPDNVWNIDQRAYCKNEKKIDWDPNGQDGEEPEEF